MVLVFHRRLEIGVLAIACLAVALAAPPRPIPTVTTLLGIAALAFGMMAMVHRWSTSRALVAVLPMTGVEMRALPIDLIPGAREPGRLTTFGMPAASGWIQDEPDTMDAVTRAERQREGGGAPGQRRPKSEPSPAHLHQWLATLRMRFPWRLRTSDV